MRTRRVVKKTKKGLSDRRRQSEREFEEELKDDGEV